MDSLQKEHLSVGLIPILKKLIISVESAMENSKLGILKITIFKVCDIQRYGANGKIFAARNW